MNGPETAARFNRTLWTALGVALSLQTFSAAVNNAVAPLALFFKPEFQLTNAQVGYLSSSMFIGTILLALPGGWLVDVLGMRWMTLISTLTMLASAVFVALVPGYFWFLGLIAGIGMAYGMCTPLTSKIVMVEFPKQLTGTAMGIKQMGVTLGGALAAVALPPLAQVYGWRFGFLFSGLVVGVTGLVALRFVEKDPEPAEGSGPGTGRISEVLGNVQLLWISGIGFLYTGFQMTFIMFLPLYLNEKLAVTTRVAGFYLGVALVGATLGRFMWGIISDRFLESRREGLISTLGVAGGLMGGVLSMLGAGTFPLLVGSVVFLIGLTAVGWNGLFVALVAEIVGQKNTGLGTGVSFVSASMGMVLVPPLYGWLVDGLGSYRVGWILISLLLGLAGVLLGLLPEGHTLWRNR